MVSDATPKQKVSLSLDADLVADLERSGPLSPQVNAALRAAAERHRRQEALEALVRSLTDTYGLDSPEDRAAIDRYVELLS